MESTETFDRPNSSPRMCSKPDEPTRNFACSGLPEPRFCQSSGEPSAFASLLAIHGIDPLLCL